MAWYRIRLALARTSEFPDGSEEHGYILIAPLTDDGHLDEKGWRAERKRATVERFWAGAETEHGHLIHTRHRNWAFSYAPGEDDDEPIFKLDRHRFSTGEYVSVTEHDGRTLPFKITAVEPIR